MLIHPQFDPVALSVGSLAIRWYGLMYVLAFTQFWFLGKWRIRSHPLLIKQGWRIEDLDDLIFFGVLGVILGARLGEILFYQPAYYFEHPLKMLAVWEGGMSFHGGFLGVLLAMLWFAHKTQRRWLEVTDFIAPLVPLGLAAGRIGNFINGELWGRAADPALPWAMIFPHVDQLPRHPSPLYQAALEGILLFVCLWFYSAKVRVHGTVSAIFLGGYGVFRFIAEYFRTPDEGIFGQSDVISMGQWLSLPMILGGIALFMYARRANK